MQAREGERDHRESDGAGESEVQGTAVERTDPPAKASTDGRGFSHVRTIAQDGTRRIRSPP